MKALYFIELISINYIIYNIYDKETITQIFFKKKKKITPHEGSYNNNFS